MTVGLHVLKYGGVDCSVFRLFDQWLVEIAGGTYVLGPDPDPEWAAWKFLGTLGKDRPLVPARIAVSPRSLFMGFDNALVVGRVELPRLPSPQRTSHRTDLPRGGHVVPWGDGPIWVFESQGVGASAGGKATDEQTAQEVEALAREWLRMRRRLVSSKSN